MSFQEIVSEVNTVMHENMPCFTAIISSLELVPNGDTMVHYVLSPLDLNVFHEKFKGHALKGSVKLKGTAKELAYPVRASF